MRGEAGTESEIIKNTGKRFEAEARALGEILNELEKATVAHPEWQTDPIHAAAVVAEESGELVQAALDHTYRHCNHKAGDTIERMKKEAIQTGAMALRFLIHLDDYTAKATHQTKGGAYELIEPDTGFFQRLKHYFLQTFR